MMTNQLYNQTRMMARFILRLDRIRLLIWISTITVMTILTASSFIGLYQNEQERQAIAETMKNPAMTAMVGPGYGLDNYTIGAMMAHQMLLFTAIAVAIMSILLVTRHTRSEEEEGRVELIRSLPVGRLSNLNATVLVLLVANILLAFIVGLGLYMLGIESMDLNGSLLYGTALGAIGIFFMAVTVLFAQLSENSRGAIGFSFTVLGVSYLIRAVGDVSNESFSMLSPLGWILRTEVFVNNHWWPIVVTVIISLILLVVAMYLNAIRDLGSGLIPTRKGRNHASRLLQSPFGLAFRIQRVGIIAWAIGMFVLGVSYGSVFGDLESFFTSNEMLSELLLPIEGLTLTEQFLTMLMAVISMVCTIPPLLMLLKLKGEENRNRTEHLLSHAISRTNLLGSYFVLSLLVGFIMLILAILGLWAAASAVMENAISFSIMFKAAIAYLPAIWLMIGVAVFLIGYFPQMTNLVWLYLGYSFIVVYLGGLLQFPEWLEKLSPFGHIPQLPVEEMNFVKVFIVTNIALVLMLIGFKGYTKRDIIG